MGVCVYVCVCVWGLYLTLHCHHQVVSCIIFLKIRLSHSLKIDYFFNCRRTKSQSNSVRKSQAFKEIEKVEPKWN